MSRSQIALLTSLTLVGATLVSAAQATAHPDPEGSTVAISSTVDSGALPLTVGFDATDTDREVLTYSWDFTGDGLEDATGPVTSWTFTEPGQHIARVTVTDLDGAVSTGELPVIAGNTRPTIVIESPVDGGWAEPGGPLPFRLAVTDTEDGVIGCKDVVVTYQVDQGQPPVETAPGPDCTGVLTPGPGQDIHLSARYTDRGANGAPPLTGSTEIVLHSREYQGSDAGLFTLPRVNLGGIDHLSMEFATRQAGVNLTVHADSPTGPVVASFANVPSTGDGVYQWLAADVADPGGVHDLYFVADQPDVFVRLIRFQTVPEAGATVTPAPANGWHNTDVAVSVGAAPLWDRQVSLDGGVTWAPANDPAVLVADGTHEVQYRAIDAAGRTSATGATTVRIDRTAPAVAAVNREHGRMAVLSPPAVTDAGSGLVAAAATLDGVPFTAPVELWRYPAGIHHMTVTATDAAGNTTTSTTEVEITTSRTELLPMLERFDLPFIKALIMRTHLMAAEAAHNGGRISTAVAWLSAFRVAASTLRDPAARDTLTADANLVIAQL
jgi:hypothetical protein